MNFININTGFENEGYRVKALASFTAVALWIAIGAGVGRAQQTQRIFPTAPEASQTLFQAVEHNDSQAIQNILGVPSDLASSRDDEQDRVDRKLFAEKYTEMHRLGRDPDGTVTLYIGAENWPFPIPLAMKDGVWRFDSEAGAKEVLYRRIGENELIAMAICHEFAAAEGQGRQEARIPPDPAIAPVRQAANMARQSPSGSPVLFHGYYFRALGRPSGTEGRNASGLVFVAYPAEYRSSGVMTFVVTERDVVYEKDLGPDTAMIASTMASFHKNSTWHVAGE